MSKFNFPPPRILRNFSFSEPDNIRIKGPNAPHPIIYDYVCPTCYQNCITGLQKAGIAWPGDKIYMGKCEVCGNECWGHF